MITLGMQSEKKYSTGEKPQTGDLVCFVDGYSFALRKVIFIYIVLDPNVDDSDRIQLMEFSSDSEFPSIVIDLWIHHFELMSRA